MTQTEHRDPDDPMMRPRYVGVPTFFRAPLRETLEDVDIGLIGVPFDGGVTSRPGARHGPREVRNQSCICLLYTSPSPRDKRQSRMPSSA